MTFEESVDRLVRAGGGGGHGARYEYEPLRFDATDAAARAALAAHVEHTAGLSLCDTLLAQLEELVDTREPALKLGRDELRQRVAAHLDGREAAHYGTWVLYPWSRELVHVLPQPEFDELRLSRNRNKITAAEQATLTSLTIGVVGLSVGQTTAVALAMEGIGGELRLADFDALTLSNLNRVRAGVADIGVNKAVVTARAVVAINPYARVRVFPLGIDDSNLDAFLGGLHLVIEECDDVYLKLRLRERARAHRLPVVMETSDRGLIDVERFDREPERPLFHGLAGDLVAAEVRGLPASERIPIALKIVGEHELSPALAASLVEVGSTLKTWPQLASAVALGAALNTEVVRRIALGQLTRSGRFRVDLEELIADGGGEAPAHAPESEAVPEPRSPPPGPVLDEGRDGARNELGTSDVRALVGYGVMAPSGGNCQPWRFVWRDGRLECRHEVERSRSLLDFRNTASYLAFGAAIENLVLAAAQLGARTSVRLFPEPTDRTYVCELAFTAGAATPTELDRSLFAAIPARVTNRKIGERSAVDAGLCDRLIAAAAARGAGLQIISDRDRLAALGRILGAGDRLRFLSPRLHAEMMRELRWTPEEVERTRDGLDIDTLELGSGERTALRVAASERAMTLVRKIGGGASLERPARKIVSAASAMLLLTVTGDSPTSFFAAGCALERVWLTATAAGWAVQPMTALTYLFARVAHGGEELSPEEIGELERLRAQYLTIFDVPAGTSEPMLMRLTRSDPPSARSLRRPVEAVLACMD